MNDEAAKLRRELERYRLRLRSNTGLRTGKVLRALVAQIEARLREIGNNSSRGTVGEFQVQGGGATPRDRRREVAPGNEFLGRNYVRR